jgi:putative ABC transport system ATP-binding protein
VTKRVWDGRTRREIISEASMELHAGDFAVLRGPSGSGKTTLLALIGAMLTPTSGEVWLHGEPTSRWRERHRTEMRRRHVGFIFQDLQLLDAMTVLENVLLPKVPEGIGAEDVAQAQHWLRRFGIDSLAASRARSLSGGERQRVAFARALVGNPSLLLLDEPTAHLDDAHVERMVDELANLAREGRSILVATHDARLASHGSVNRRWTMVAGRLRSDESPEESPPS